MNNHTTKQRLHYLDAMRSILMILGILLHSANVFSDSDWAIKNINTSEYFTYLIDTIHIFRMPAFFIVSGFFCHMTLKKNGPIKFINIRLPRIIIPFLVTAVTLNTLQNYILINSNLTDIDITDIRYWLSGSWVSHLWFLNTLIYYFIFSALFYYLTPNLLNNIKKITNNIINHTNGYYLFIIPIVSMGLLKISYIFPNVSEQYYDAAIADSIKYSIYFVFGIILGTNKNLLSEFVRPKKAIILLCMLIITIFHYWEFDSALINKLLSSYKTALIIWLSCVLCFYIFNSLFNKKSILFTYLAGASYTIYLFHHIFVILIGILIIQTEINIVFKFILLVSMTFIITNLIHYYLISKYSILSRIFNGKSLN